MNQPIVVSILTFNSSATIRACLDSLVAQTESAFTVHIIDDASTDTTRTIIAEYDKKLNITLIENGSHNIPRGRNIALKAVKNGICAFVDSDDTVSENWVETIAQTFRETSGLAMISGQQVTSYRTEFAQSVAANDAVMRKLFGGGVLQFCTCNCAINRDVMNDFYFNEMFKNGEDIEFVARVEKTHTWKYVDNLRVYHTTRDTLKAYCKQMYMYGMWKLFFAYATQTFRIVDVIPLGYGIACVILGSLYTPLILAILLLPLAQTLVTVTNQHVSRTLWIQSFLAWCCKNVCWSLGICVGVIKLIIQPKFNKQLRVDIST